ncbi:DUF4424 domain-containing protein [Methylorubrum populi]|jgi:Domain of unknown function (DUF4424)|uniref:DUF4424 family protein n=1 Tax=Methylorubrum rhodesianum TaxID=29427 RepID=A0ABU9ZC13_9HYPH|nr:DUF4424 family protein [Methylorubrum rhodesianum]MBK3405017.1 DUF4424 domain-containing protein [Methylorubrum rhodesianum]MBY0138952.1 DUF4424 domain-containing protein [Methylorubrum populi]
MRRGWAAGAGPGALLLALALSASPARANDSAATLDAGGLVLVRDTEIELASEDLRIAIDRIDVDYAFRNRSQAPRTLRLAFPLPPIDGAELSFSALSLPVRGSANFVGFTVKADGKTIEPALEERAFHGTQEVTERLKRHGLPLNPLRREELETALKRLSPADLQALHGAGLLSDATPDAGAQWRSEAKFHWEQVFPADAELRISHSYAPVAGNWFLSPREAATREVRARYCLDDAGLAGIRRLAAARPEGYTRAFEVPYIVTTARNWAGRIGRFTLTVDKGRADALVSFCRQGVRKTGPTTFAWEARDYVPDSDLRVLLVSNDPAFLGDR